MAKISEFAVGLPDRSLPDAEREVALEWVVHLVGDVHQPLNDEDDRDRGGNGVRVTWAGRATNLHHVWDSDLVRAAGRNPEELAERLDSNAPAIATGGTPADWANEAHALAPGAYSLPYSLADTSKIGFDGAFQHEDFAKPWEKRRIAVAPNFERDVGLAAYRAWMNKKDRHPY